MSELLVYAIGDSIMWGEGLNTEDKFAMRAATSLAQARGLTPNLRLLAHCGAKIKATRDERIRFTDLFPHLFTEEKRSRFIFADDTPSDESATDLQWLHGEIPRAFPTIHHQLRSIPDDEAAGVDLMLITGGANDLDFETVFQQSGNFLEKLDGQYKRIFYDDIFELLVAARRKCPKAHIVLTGYYSAFSLESQFDDMKDMFLELSKKKNAYEFLSTIRLVSLALGSLVVFYILDHFKDDADEKIKSAIKLARATSESGESRAHYWMRKAVSDINDSPTHAAIRGPGLSFASPGFLPKNCMFAPQSFTWQQYKTDKLDDDQRVIRAERCPRNHLRKRMADMRTRYSQFQLSPGRWPPTAKELLELHNNLDGPVALRAQILSLVQNPLNTRLWRAFDEALQEEIDRIDITRLSSLIHPNRPGAARYAAVVHKRAEELRSTNVGKRLLAFLPPDQRPAPPFLMSVDKTIRRFGLDPAMGVRACLAHAEPDVLRLAVRTNRASDVFSREIFLNLGVGGRRPLRQLLMIDLPGTLDLNPHLHPGKTDLFTIDVAGQLYIGDITRMTIEIEQAANDSARWRPEELTLSIDGRDVFTETFTDPPEVVRNLSLEFPRARV